MNKYNVSFLYRKNHLDDALDIEDKLEVNEIDLDSLIKHAKDVAKNYQANMVAIFINDEKEALYSYVVKDLLSDEVDIEGFKVPYSKENQIHRKGR